MYQLNLENSQLVSGGVVHDFDVIMSFNAPAPTIQVLSPLIVGYITGTITTADVITALVANPMQFNAMTIKSLVLHQLP